MKPATSTSQRESPFSTAGGPTRPTRKPRSRDRTDIPLSATAARIPDLVDALDALVTAALTGELANHAVPRPTTGGTSDTGTGRNGETHPDTGSNTAAGSNAAGGDAEVDGDAEMAFRRRFRRLLDSYRTKTRILGWAQAAIMEDLSAITHLRPPQGTPSALAFDDFAPADVAIEAGISPATATHNLLDATSITHRLPHALHALKHGEIDLPRLRSLDDAVSPLDDETAAAVEAHVLADGPRPTRRAFREACNRAVLLLDPDGAAERAEVAREDRRLRITPGENNTSTLSALLPAEDADACYQRVDQLARDIAGSRGPDDTRTRDQIRADVLVDLLTGRAEHGKPFSCDVQVIIPLTALLGLTSDPAEIPGIGPIPAAIAREMAARPGSTWRRLLTDPQGQLLEVGDRRFPTPAQARHVQARDRTCRMPGCARPATRCDLDHTIPYSHGGKTVTANLGPLCRKHHRLRHLGSWKLTQPTPGTFHWTTTLGHEITVTPHSYLNPPPNRPATRTDSTTKNDPHRVEQAHKPNQGWPEYDPENLPF